MCNTRLSLIPVSCSIVDSTVSSGINIHCYTTSELLIRGKLIGTQKVDPAL